MNKMRNIEKKFFLILGMFFLILSIATHVSCFTFGFMSGIGLTGWILLPKGKGDTYDFKP